MSKNYFNMAIADDLLHGNKVVDYQEDSLTKDGLVNMTHGIACKFGNILCFSLMIKETHAQKSTTVYIVNISTYVFI